MAVEIITKEDLNEFKEEVLKSIGKMLSEQRGQYSKQWLKSYEVKKLLGISSGTLQNLRVNGTLPFTKIGGVLYYAHQDVEKMLEENKRQNYRRPLIQ